MQTLAAPCVDGCRTDRYGTPRLAGFRHVTEQTARNANTRRNARRLALRRRAQGGHFRFYSRWSAWTFLQNVATTPISWRREHWILGCVAIVLCVLVGIVMPNWASAMRQPQPDAGSRLTVSLALPPALENPIDATASTADADAHNWRIYSVQSGQNASDIFQKAGVDATALQTVLGNHDNASALRNIHPGDEFAFDTAADGHVSAVRFDRDDHTRVTVSLGNNAGQQEILNRPLERRTHIGHGVITRSLFEAGEQAGLSDAMVLKLADALGYDIDFLRGLREGDSFSVVYDDMYREGDRLRDGDIIAATFTNQGKRYSAIRYTDSEGNTMYYSEDGRPLRKTFLLTPVAFTRISSMFSTGRMHPILGYMRAHQGVDYAAPIGTPVRAAGDAKVAFRGWQNGYGNVVVLQHNGHYSTLYGHMSRFGSIAVGQHVSQGQTIGFVGMTGLATGPHLHYEFRIDGQHRDPLTVTLPKAEPLPNIELARFRLQSQPMIARLHTLESTQRLASAK